MIGYLHRDYALSLAEYGRPRLLPRSKGWILERDVPGTPHKDAMGVYPLFCCQDWSGLEADVEELRELVSLVVVVDPLSGNSLSHLAFFDIVVSFKHHYIVDLSDVNVSKHHRRSVRKARKLVRVERVERPGEWLDDWVCLYQNLIERHSIEGIARFSRAAFGIQLGVPGLVAFRAIKDGETVGMLLWYEQGDRAYYHLGAFSEEGYKTRASFALFQESIEYFTGRVDWLNLGAGAGIGSGEGGLSRFKGGWTSVLKPAYLCGKILDIDIYHRLAVAGNDFFPAYRDWL